MSARPLGSQRGVVLIEAMISVVIISFGILAIVGMQANAVRLSSDAKYRSDAVLAVNQLIGEMQSGDRTTAALQGAYQNGGAAYAAWRAGIQLPGIDANPPNVVVDGNGVVTITVSWLQPGEPGEMRHSHQAVTRIVGVSCAAGGIC